MSVDIYMHNMWGIFCVPVLGEFSHFVNVTVGMKMPLSGIKMHLNTLSRLCKAGCRGCYKVGMFL